MLIWFFSRMVWIDGVPDLPRTSVSAMPFDVQDLPGTTKMEVVQLSAVACMTVQVSVPYSNVVKTTYCTGAWELRKTTYYTRA
jgi:hypothetical protein